MSPIAISPPASPSAAPVAHPVEKPFHQSLEGLSDNPLDRTWRGNAEGTIDLLQKAPRFSDDMDGKLAERKWIKEHMAAAFQFWGKRGFGEGISGHITVRDPILTDHYWMNPIAVHFSQVKVSNLVLVGPGGYVSKEGGGAQLAINTAGYFIHTAIHRARPEVKAAGHCHSLYGRAWSVFGKPVDILTQDSCLFHGNQGVYSNFGGIVLAKEEGENIAKAMGSEYKTCILQNHGLLTVGETVDEMVYLFSALENQCRIQLMVEAASEKQGLTKEHIDPVDAEFTAKTLQHWENTYLNVSPSLLPLLPLSQPHN
ncbi:arad-like aldolase/epimerase [Pseudohyphozyma bogoriensis]|nr:arad-like aldolase/epimerase [Pseudohyphozyma bogoriensis]